MPQLRIDPLEACDRAAKMLRRAGFELIYSSMSSTSCYYSFPGRAGLVRIATHRKAKNPALQNQYGPPLISVTFPEGNVKKDGTLSITDEYIEGHTARAIGLYLMRAERK